MDRWEPKVPEVEQIDTKTERLLSSKPEKRARSRSSSRSRSDKRRAREESTERRRRRERDQSAERRRRRREESAERRHRDRRDSRDERTPRGSGSRRDSREREPARGGGGRDSRYRDERERHGDRSRASDDRHGHRGGEKEERGDHGRSANGDRHGHGNREKEERGDKDRSANGDRASERREEPSGPKRRPVTPPRSNGREKRESSASPTPQKRPIDGAPPPPTPPAAAAAATAAPAAGQGAAAAGTAAAVVAGGGSRLGPEEAGKPAWGIPEPEEDEEEAQPVEKANFGLSGALAQDKATGNVYRGVVLKWSEPPDARRPTKRWRLYSFKENELIDTLHIHRQSAFLVGREQKIADLMVAHPSCSKQHAVIQFRYRPAEADAVAAAMAAGDPAPRGEVLPYIMDLESANGTYLNKERIEHSRYIELREKDTIKFGMSSREYVLLHEDSGGG